MSPEQLKSKIETLSEDTQVQVHDLTGTQNHYEVYVVSTAFEGVMRIKRQRMVMGILKQELDSGEVHALTMKTVTPEEFEKFKSDQEKYDHVKPLS